MDEVNIKLIYEGEEILRKFAYILAKTATYLAKDDGRCVKSWDGWIKIGEKTTLVENACIVCLLSNTTHFLKEGENIPIEKFILPRIPPKRKRLIIKRDRRNTFVDRF